MRFVAPSPSEVAMLARLTRDLPRFLRVPITPEQAAATVRRRLAERTERFLELVERTIYARPRSPYRQLLRVAGCELGDLRALVDREGVEGALAQLAERGVYVSFEEFKGRREIVRGSQRIAAAETDFDNSDRPGHFERRTGGTRSPGTVVRTSLRSIADLAAHQVLALEAHGLGGADHVLWQMAPIYELLLLAKSGHPPLAWFHPLAPLPWKARAVGEYLQAYGRLVGCRLPPPRWLDLQRPERLAAWLVASLAPERSICLRAPTSSAVRVAVAARERGLALAGVCFITLGEPVTGTRRAVFETSGARALVNYASVETGALAYLCAEPRGPDDLHFFADSFALIQQPRKIGDFALEVGAFLLTTLLPSTPKLLLNVENGDHGAVEWRACGCGLGALGLEIHVSEIRSHEKLTSEGMTFVRSRLLPLLEEILPVRFGGSAGDYQVLEEENAGGILRLYLLVNPRVGPVDEDAVRRTFLAELAGCDELDRHIARLWERARTVQIRRQTPVATGAGKVQPFHVARQPHRR